MGLLVERRTFTCFEVEAAAVSSDFFLALSLSDCQLVRVSVVHGDSLLLLCSIVKKEPTVEFLSEESSRSFKWHV